MAMLHMLHTAAETESRLKVKSQQACLSDADFEAAY